MTTEQEVKRDLLKGWYCQRGLPMTDFIRDVRQIQDGHSLATLGESIDKMYEEWEQLGNFRKAVEGSQEGKASK